MPRRSKPDEVQVVVLSGSGEQTHNLRLTRKKVAIAVICWLVVLLAVAFWGFQSGGGASGESAGGATGSGAGRASRQ
jgi:hypothetical protein